MIKEKYLVFVSLIFILISPILFTKIATFISFNNDDSSICNVLTGCMSPFIYLFTALLLYFTLNEQKNTNSKVQSQISLIKETEQKKIVHSQLHESISFLKSLLIPEKNDDEYLVSKIVNDIEKGNFSNYQLLYNIVKRFLYMTEEVEKLQDEAERKYFSSLIIFYFDLMVNQNNKLVDICVNNKLDDIKLNINLIYTKNKIYDN